MKLYHMLPKDIIGDRKYFYVQPMEDECIYFLGVHFSEIELAAAFKKRLLEFARQKELPLTTRNSFGFCNTNMSDIGADFVRLNPGLDDEKTLKQYAAFFKEVAKIVQEVENSNGNSPHIIDLIEKMDFDSISD